MRDKKKERKNIIEAYTKKDILESAIKIITTHGIQGLTMDKVASEAGVAKGTLYVYFKNKEEIVEAGINTGFEPLIEELSSILNQDLLPVEKLEKFSYAHIAYFDANKDFFRVLLYDRQRAQNRRRRYHQSRYWDNVKKVAAVFDEGVKLGCFRSINTTKVAAMFLDAHIAVVIQRLFDQNSEEIENDVELIKNVFMNGILLKNNL